jgi:serine/threonine protein kinase
MSLSPGARLGPYEVLAFVGAGGMGEVYKARDSRLDRTVAIKLLPSDLSSDVELRHRFRREARAVAALAHPHICVLHDISEQNGAEFLVMEYLDGETLAARLAKGPLPLDQALRHAVDIASALDKAHRRGIVHRDLKPGNVMLTREGAKLLDFGLAKLRPEPGPVAGISAAATATAALTGEGRIIGTLNYMAPEQLHGRDVDTRADIFAFGAMVHEMVTGHRAFDGGSQATVIAAILERDPPPMSTCQPLAPPMLDHLVRRCLAKDPDERWQSAHDVLVDLRWIAEHGSDPPTITSPAARRRRRWWAVAAGGALALAAFALPYLSRPRESPSPMQFTIAPPEGVTLMPGPAGLSVSPDGRWFTFAASDADTPWPRWKLWLRRADSLGAEPLPGTERGLAPFWSPDSRSVAFSVDGQVKRVDLGGGPVKTLCECVATNAGGTWNTDGTIVFAATGGLARVAATGGEAKPLTRVDRSRGEWVHAWPEFLPDGRQFLYIRSGGEPPTQSRLYVGSLDAPEGRVIGSATSNTVYAAGQALFVREGVLYAQPFDAGSSRFTGDAVRLAAPVVFRPESGRAAFAASSAGALVYRRGGLANLTQLTWFDLHGKELATVGSPRPGYGAPALSPDETRAAVTDHVGTPDQPGDIWLIDLGRGSTSRFTSDPGDDHSPVFSPDGERVVFSSNRRGHLDLYTKAAGGAGGERLLLETADEKSAKDWSRDGRFIAFERYKVGGDMDIWILPMDEERKPLPFVHGPAIEGVPRFSPDGRFIAYQSLETGKSEVYVQPFPPTGQRWQVSTSGGSWPRWRGDGRELFYNRKGTQGGGFAPADDRVMAVDVRTTANGFEAGMPRELMRIILDVKGWTVTRDGKRFLASVRKSELARDLAVMLNWQTALAGRR